MVGSQPLVWWLSTGTTKSVLKSSLMYFMYYIIIFKKTTFYKIFISEPSDLTLRIYRAESYAGLQEFKAAIEDLNAVLFQLPNWPEVKMLFIICIHFKISTVGNMHSIMVISYNRMDCLTLSKISRVLEILGQYF